MTGVGVEAVIDGCLQLRAFDVSQCKNLNAWLENGGVERFADKIVFETVAGQGKMRR